QIKSNLHIVRAQTAFARGESALAVSFLRRASQLTPTSRHTLMAIVEILTAQGMVEEARQMVSEARARRPAHRVQAILWSDEIDRLETMISSDADSPTPRSTVKD